MEEGVEGLVATPERLMVRVVPIELVNFKEPDVLPAEAG